MADGAGMKEKTAAAILVVLGLLAMVGDALREDSRTAGAGRALVGFATATCASPAPRVFAAVEGLETCSTRIAIEWTGRDGALRSLELTPELYSRIRGPYVRRNVYGAALAHAPLLARDERTRRMFELVVRHALCGEAPLLRELGVDPETIDGAVTVWLVPEDGGEAIEGPVSLSFEAPCDA
jgi:hypothetical protein